MTPFSVSVVLRQCLLALFVCHSSVIVRALVFLFCCSAVSPDADESLMRSSAVIVAAPGDRLGLRVFHRHAIDLLAAAELGWLARLAQEPAMSAAPTLVLPRVVVGPDPRARHVPSRELVDIEISLVLEHRLHHALPVLLQLRDAVLDHALALQAHGEILVELAQLVAIEVGFACARDKAEELPAHVFGVVGFVRGDLLREPVAPDREADPLHDVVGVAGAADGVAVGAADGLGALEGFGVVAEEVGLGGDGEVFEEGGFGGEDGDDSGAEVVVAEGGLDGGAVEAAGTVDEGFFPEGFAAQAVGEVEPGAWVGGDGAMEDLAEGEERGFDGAGDERGLEGC